jgi:pimeloyl-ACP methyl ester carboxylesterase
MKHASTAFEAVPFTVAIADDVLDDLKQRIAQARIPQGVDEAGWTEGMDGDALRTVLTHWRDFDWPTAQATINRVPAYRAEIDGYDIHFIHVPGKGTSRVPLILTNGWPSCFTELLPLVPLLTEEINGLSFDVVIPSLPGYGFSASPRERGTNISRIADIWSKLMSGLGYDRFVAHGSDMGSGVAERLRANHADRMMGIHLMNVNWFYPRPSDLTDEEEAYLNDAQQWQLHEGAYTMIHSSKPQTIASALNDSPAGLAAWIGEKFRGWSDGGGRIDGAIALDALCTVLTIYWATQTIGSSQRLYREAFTDAGVMLPPPKHGAPVGVAVFPYDIAPAPRSWGERWLDISHWTVMPRGGHFPGFEAPDLLAADIREFVARLPLRSGN